MRFILTIISLLILSVVHSQAELTIEISGRVVDKASKSPIEFATVLAVDTSTQSILQGVVTDGNGDFILEVTDSVFFIKIRQMGFNELLISEFSINNSILNLGDIQLESTFQDIDDVTVRAERSQTVFKLDKRIFNVGKDLASSGGSALDVLNNVPSVEITLEGAISLRGNSNVQILINGKPSVIASGSTNALGTITADMIDRIEVVTNPSAKYDAEGTSGIINIVLRKEKRQGTNGSFTVNTGFPNNHSVGLSLNHRREKLNIFTQLGAGRRTFITNSIGESINRTPTYTRLTNSGHDEKNETFINILLGADVHFNKLNTLTISGHYAYEWEDQYSNTNYQLLNHDQLNSGKMLRTDTTKAINPKWQYDIRYTKDFKNGEDHQLTISVLGSYFGKDKTSFYNNSLATGNFSNLRQYSGADFKEGEYVFQADYSRPILKSMRMDVGAKYQLNDISNDYYFSDLINNSWVTNTGFTNLFEYTQQVLAGYMTYAVEIKKIGIQAGLRYEHSDILTHLKTTQESNQQNYGNFFPSAHASYNFSKKTSMQLGYSRRISRPGLWELNPFNSLQDNFNISNGNPNLTAEYTNSFELSTIHNWNKASISLIGFYSQTTDIISEWITVIDNISYSSPQNIGVSNNLGVEVTAKIKPSKWLSLLADGNWIYFDRTGIFQGTSFDFNSSFWEVRLQSNFKLPWEMELQWSMRYQSAEKDVFQEQLENYFADFGLRKKVLKKRGVINLSVRDVFSSRRYTTQARTESYYFYSNHQRGRYIVIGFSYSFGKGEAMEFSGQKMF